MCDESGITQRRFGTDYERLMMDFRLDEFSRSQMICIIRITDRAMLHELECADGIDTMLGLSQERFEEAQERFLERMKVEMDQLRRLLEEIRYEGGESFLVMLRNLEQDCDDEGHQSCLRSLERNRERAAADFGTP